MTRGALEQRIIADPNDYIPMKFSVDVEIRERTPGANLVPGDQGRGQVAINDRQFILRQLTHQIIPTVVGVNVNVSQDGIYRLDWSEYEQVRYYKGAIPMADIAYGSVRDGNWIPLKAPVVLPGNQTLHVVVINEATRAIPLMQVQVIFHGLQHKTARTRLGEPTTPRNLEV